MKSDTPILELKDVTVLFDTGKQAVRNFSASFRANTVTGLIGHKGSGKSSLLRAINRMHDIYPYVKVTGEILLDGQSIFSRNVFEVRREIGMVFSKPHFFPNLSILDNVLAGYKMNNIRLSQSEKLQIAEEVLQSIDLWDEVKGDLDENPKMLNYGQQQQLCIARSLAMNPRVLLMDQPTELLDVSFITRIEDMIVQQKKRCTILIVPGNISQAARTTDYTIYMEEGELVEYQTTSKLFWNPDDKRTEKYITAQTH